MFKVDIHYILLYHIQVDITTAQDKGKLIQQHKTWPCFTTKKQLRQKLNFTLSNFPFPLAHLYSFFVIAGLSMLCSISWF